MSKDIQIISEFSNLPNQPQIFNHLLSTQSELDNPDNNTKDPDIETKINDSLLKNISKSKDQVPGLNKKQKGFVISSDLEKEIDDVNINTSFHDIEKVMLKFLR